MRKVLLWTGWTILFALPIVYGIQILVTDDLPGVQLWQWAILAATVLLIWVSRNRDDVLKHRIA